MDGEPDFCWAFGLGLSVFWFEFPGASDKLDGALLERAKELDPFYARLNQEEMGWFDGYVKQKADNSVENFAP